MDKRSASTAMRAIVSVVVAGSLLGFVSAPATAREDIERHGCSNGEQIVLSTFHVQMKAVKKVYRIGDQAKIKVNVTRPGHSDPLGLGIETGPPPMSMPAENANVGVGIQIKDVYLVGYGTTDEDGKVTISIRLERYTPPGVAVGRSQATDIVAETTCATILEQGFIVRPQLFKVVR